MMDEVGKTTISTTIPPLTPAAQIVMKEVAWFFRMTPPLFGLFVSWQAAMRFTPTSSNRDDNVKVVKSNHMRLHLTFDGTVRCG
ncbi:MAG: hypothetical protein LBR77_06320, partial [Lachnospiraceae bacterium]|nr:hypothetical protein [Lachnospiraceae bacterium]